MVQAGDALVKISGDRLTVQAYQTPLQDILRQMAAQGIQVSIDPDINPEITAKIANRPVEASLKSILNSIDHIVIWESIHDSSGDKPVLAEIQVFKPGQKSKMQPLAISTGFDIARHGEDGPFFVPGEILVRVNNGAHLKALTDAITETGGRIGPVEKHPGLYRIVFPPDFDVFDIAEQLKDFEGVSVAEPNYAYPLPRRLRAALPKRLQGVKDGHAAVGSQVSVAVLDSGIRADVDLQGRVQASLNAIDTLMEPDDAHGHGTQMALIASGLVAPVGKALSQPLRTDVLPIKVFDENGFTTSLSVLESVAFAIEKGARVLSLSWGSENKSDVMESIFNEAADRGLTMVAAAGNEATGKPVYPAAYDSVIGVGALEPDGRQWKKSNFGDSAAVFAPGFATLPVGYQGDPGAYAGTSIATAYTANLVAGYLSQYPAATREEVLKYLQKVLNP